MIRIGESVANSKRHLVLLCCLVLGAASFLLYGQTLKYDFSRYDDYKLIGEHPQLYSDGTLADRIRQILYRDIPREEPLIVRDLSWLVDSSLFGYNRPFGYHYGNVIYHSATLVLAFLLVLRLTNFKTALISALLLLVMAAHMTTWVSE